MAEAACDDRPLVFEDLVRWMAEGAKPASEWRVGAEHEKFVFRLTDHAPVPYEPNGIKALLDGLTRFGWKPVMEGDHVIALERGMANVSLEPGGQFELSGAPLETVHDICEETGQHLEEVKQVADELGLGFLGLGFTPIWRRDEVPVMPKGRYKIMREYMPKVGGLGLDMMFRTCTVQANLDFGDEADMVAKFRTSLALQPIATALFANSPFVEGKPSGFVSARANVWTDTDPDRTGMLDFVFRDGFGFGTYARYALQVPMYFVKRGDRYIDVAGRSFVDFMDGKLPELPGDPARDLGDLQRMGQPRPVEIAVPQVEDLGLALQSAEGCGMNDPRIVDVRFVAGILALRLPIFLPIVPAHMVSFSGESVCRSRIARTRPLVPVRWQKMASLSTLGPDTHLKSPSFANLKDLWHIRPEQASTSRVRA